MTGSNLPNGERLEAFLKRYENLQGEIDELRDDQKVVMAEVKSDGFDPKIVRWLLKRRKMDSHDRDEQDDLRSVYATAVGLERETPLFKAVGLMSVDRTVREDVLKAFSAFVPDEGDVILRFGGSPVRLWRDSDGVVQIEDWQPPAPPAPTDPASTKAASAQPAIEIPDVDESGAKILGATAHENGEAVTANPFPARDPRRRAWDRGWRDKSGGDGMGPTGGEEP